MLAASSPGVGPAARHAPAGPHSQHNIPSGWCRHEGTAPQVSQETSQSAHPGTAAWEWSTPCVYCDREDNYSHSYPWQLSVHLGHRWPIYGACSCRAVAAPASLEKQLREWLGHHNNIALT